MEKQKKIIIKEFALKQLEDEYNYYTGNYSIDFAEKFKAEFFIKIKNILPLFKRYPICKNKKPMNKSYRQIVWKNYLIIFLIKDELIEVLCLFHTKQNPKKINKLIKSYK